MRSFTAPRVAILAAMVGLGGCAGQNTDAAHDPVGIWTGALVTDDGTCPTTRFSTLQINARDVTFTPGDGAVTLHGIRGQDPNKYHAEFVTQDANHHPFAMVFNAMPVGRAIGGIYGTPSCRAHITLTRPRD